MDLSDGSDAEEELNGNDIDENDLLAASDDDEQQGHGHKVETYQNQQSRTYNQQKGPAKMESEDNDNDGDYLDLETGDDDELSLQSFPTDGNEKSLAPVKVRAVVQEKLMQNTTECTSTSVPEDDSSEYLEDVECDSTNDTTADLDDEDEETRSERSRFHTERKLAVAPSQQTSTHGNPIRSLGVREVRPQQHPQGAYNGPRFRGQRLGPGPGPHRTFMRPPPPFMRPPGPPGPGFFMGRRPPPMPLMQNRFNGSRRFEPPIYQFHEQGIFTDFSDPGMRKQMPHLMPQMMGPRFRPSRRDIPRQHVPRLQQRQKISTDVRTDISKDTPHPKPSGSSDDKPNVQLVQQQGRTEIYVVQEKHEKLQQPSHPAVIITRHEKSPQKNSLVSENNVILNTTCSTSSNHSEPESQTNPAFTGNPQPESPATNIHGENKPAPFRPPASFRFRGPDKPLYRNVPPPFLQPQTGTIFQGHQQVQTWNPQPQPLMMQPNLLMPGPFPSNFQHPDFLNFQPAQPFQNQWMTQNPVHSNLMTGPPAQSQFFEQQQQQAPLHFVPNQVPNFSTFLDTFQQPAFLNQAMPIVSGDIFNPNFQSPNFGMQYQFQPPNSNPSFIAPYSDLPAHTAPTPVDRKDRYPEQREQHYESRSPTKRRRYEEEEDFDGYGDRKPRLQRRLGPPPEVNKDKEAEIVKIIMETKKEMGVEDDEYLKKIEDQKRKREEILRLKEQRRKGIVPQDTQESREENSSCTERSMDKGGSSNVKSVCQSIHLNPKTFNGELLNALSTNLKKINVNVTAAPPSSVIQSTRSDSVSRPSGPSHSQSSHSPNKNTATRKDLEVKVSNPKAPASVSSEDQSAGVKKRKIILRVVKNKKGEVISRSKVLVTKK